MGFMVAMFWVLVVLLSAISIFVAACVIDWVVKHRKGEHGH